MNGELTFRVIYTAMYLSALSIRVYYTRKTSPVVEKNFRKRWKKVAEGEGRISAVLWTILSVFWISFTILYAILHSEWISGFSLQLPLWLR